MNMRNTTIQSLNCLEDRWRANIRRQLQLRKRYNLIQTTLNNLQEPETKYVEGMIFPTEYNDMPRMRHIRKRLFTFWSKIQMELEGFAIM